MFGKIFDSMFKGSMVGSGALTFAVWSYVIANMEPGRDGNMWVTLNSRLLGPTLGEPEKDVEGTIEKLCNPDPMSTCKDEDGRRLVRDGQFLFRVVNGAAYRAMQDEEAHREYQRKWVKEKRANLPKRSKPGPGQKIFENAVGRGDQASADAIIDEVNKQSSSGSKNDL